jgi:hypothetical protein
MLFNFEEVDIIRSIVLQHYKDGRRRRDTHIIDKMKHEEYEEAIKIRVINTTI